MSGAAGRAARLGVLGAVALALGYVESFIPLAPGLPGIKLGLANTVLLYAVYLETPRAAWMLMAAKVLLSGFLFAGASAMLYSLAGGVLSMCAMFLGKRVKGLSIPGVSVAGALFHNLGQILAACLLIQPKAVLPYLPVLLVSAVITGLLTGIVAMYVIRSLRKGHKL